MTSVGKVETKPISPAASNQATPKVDPKNIEKTFGPIVNVQKPEEKAGTLV